MLASMPVCNRYNKAQELALELGFLIERAGNGLYKVWRGVTLSISTELVGIAKNLKEVSDKINETLMAAVADEAQAEFDEYLEVQSDELSPGEVNEVIDEFLNKKPIKNPDPQTEEDLNDLLSPEDAAIVMSVYFKSNFLPDEIGDVRIVEDNVSIGLKSGYTQLIMKITYLNTWRVFHGLKKVDYGDWKTIDWSSRRQANVDPSVTRDYMRIYNATGLKRANILSQMRK